MASRDDSDVLDVEQVGISQKDFFLAVRIAQAVPYFSLWPSISNISGEGEESIDDDDYPLILNGCGSSVKSLCRKVAEKSEFEFCWSPSFDKQMIVRIKIFVVFSKVSY